MDDASFLASLEACTLPEAEFGHAGHVRAAFLYLRRLPFAEAVGCMSRALRRFATALGKGDRYHETITIAFMALVAERLADEGGEPEWPGFAGRHPDLMRKDALLAWYSADTLASERARRTFVLPRFAPGGPAAR